MLKNLSHRWLTVEPAGAVTRFRIAHSLLWSEEEIKTLAECLEGLMEGSESRQFVLNLGQVEHMASSMVGVLVALHKKAHARGGRLILCGLRGQPAEVLETMRLTQFLHIRREEQEALQSF